MGRRLTENEIKNQVNKLGYKLINTFRNRHGQPMVTVSNINNYIGAVNFMWLRGNSHKIAPFHQSNPYTIKNIKVWLKLNNKNYNLISTKYESAANHKLEWHCPKCNENFYMTWNDVRNGQCCSVCRGYQVKYKTSLGYNYPHLVKEWNKKNELSIFKVAPKTSKKAWWICSTCNHEWEASINSRTHLGYGCPGCYGRDVTDKNRLSIINPELIKEWSYKNEMTPDSVSYGSGKKVWWICFACNYEWKTYISHRTRGQGCPSCSSSLGEKKVESFLVLNQIEFKKQMTFDGCKHKKVLRFDFYIPEHNMCIEYNGKQHYEIIDWFGGESGFNSQQIKDKIKRNFCKKNNIKLLEIPYWEFDNAERILKECLYGK